MSSSSQRHGRTEFAELRVDDGVVIYDVRNPDAWLRAEVPATIER